MIPKKDVKDFFKKKNQELDNDYKKLKQKVLEQEKAALEYIRNTPIDFDKEIKAICQNGFEVKDLKYELCDFGLPTFRYIISGTMIHESDKVGGGKIYKNFNQFWEVDGTSFICPERNLVFKK